MLEPTGLKEPTVLMELTVPAESSSLMKTNTATVLDALPEMNTAKESVVQTEIGGLPVKTTLKAECTEMPMGRVRALGESITEADSETTAQVLTMLRATQYRAEAAEQLLEISRQRLALTNERAVVAYDRAAANEQLALVAQRWAEWYRHQMMVMVQQRADESRWCQSVCEDAQQRVAFEIKQRLAAEEHIAATEQLARSDEECSEITTHGQDDCGMTTSCKIHEEERCEVLRDQLLTGASEHRALAKRAVNEAVSACVADTDRRVAVEVELRCRAEHRGRLAERLLLEAQERVTDLMKKLSEAEKGKSAQGEVVQETVVSPLRSEAGAGQVRKQQEVAVIWQCEASVEPPAEDEGRPTKTVEVKTYVEALFTPSVCMKRSAKPAAVNALKQCAVGGLVQKCKRCGGYDHTHEVCVSTKPFWGRDWREYRQRRRHRRSVRPSAEKEDKSVAGAKIRTSVGGRLKEVEDSTKQGAYQRRFRQAEQLKEVAQVGDALDMEPATGSAVPGS